MIPTSDEEEFLDKLAWELHGTYCMMAYAGYESNTGWLKKRATELSRIYDPPVRPEDSVDGEQTLLDFVTSDFGIIVVKPAFWDLADFISYSPELRKEEAANLAQELAEYVSGDNDYSFMNAGVFSKYCAFNPD